MTTKHTKTLYQDTFTLQPAVAGMFYPQEPNILRKMVENFLHTATLSTCSTCSTAQQYLTIPKALIAPHAGYIYSGAIAGSAYACLYNAEKNRETEQQIAQITTVIILAPSHHYAIRGIATTSAAFYATPLGKIKIATDKITQLIQTALPFVTVLNEAFTAEHAIEVQLPFLQVALNNWTIVPLLVGDASPQEVAATLSHLWGGGETLIVVSSDLSHYYPYDVAQLLDAQAAAAILTLNYAALTDEMACGAAPIRGLLHLAKSKNLRALQIDLRNSGDTAGDKSQVVGYGAFHFMEDQNDAANKNDTKN